LCSISIKKGSKRLGRNYEKKKLNISCYLSEWLSNTLYFEKAKVLEMYDNFTNSLYRVETQVTSLKTKLSI